MTPYLAISNGLTSAIAKIFHPIVYAVAWMLAFIYGLIPNYAVAIAILTVIIMGLLTPLTVKSTKSMIAMQRLQPELKRLQQKYKGPEHRQELNEEMMKLYREQGVNPATGCITGLLQAPFLFILYSVIRGLSNTVTVNGKLVSMPRNIPPTSKMYTALTHAHPPGAMYVWHMNIALKPISSHGSIWAAIPFYVLIAVAVGVQYFQMSQLNRRNPNAAQMSSQMLMFQRLTPILFAYIYFIVPAAAVIYMIFSSLIRILTQDLIFRYDRPKPPTERSIPAAPPTIDEGGDARNDVKPDGKVTPQARSNGRNGSGTKPAAAAPKPAAAAPKPVPQHPRSRDKRKRKAR
ncbi:MAG TPA: YidC/Oxa1 family membrane protein insertase [Acidimicrobiales bacterium]|jgi:YidC/Oxa1 family membrane protein insertase|nr:YidC/Oxa1 family membrane protein insertase [Acidimicrobiales bacterium]